MSRLRLNKSVAPSAPAANKAETWYDSTVSRTRVIDEKGMKVDTSGGIESVKALINGGFRFAQRQIPATLTSYALTGGRSYAADRWGMTIQTSSLQYARVDTATTPETGLQARYYGQFKQITGSGRFNLSQVVEGSACLAMRNRQVRLMCVMKASAAKTIRLGLLQLQNAGTIDTMPATFITWTADTLNPTWGTSLALIVPDILPLACFGVTTGTQATRNTAVDCSVTTAWQTFGALFTVPSDCKNLIPVIWTDSAFSINDILNVSQVTLLNQPGDADWNELPVGDEVALCQRYYFKTFNMDTAPAQNAGTGTGEFKFMGTVVGALAMAGIGFRFPAPMRAAPATLTLYNPSATNAQVRNVTDAADQTASTITVNGEQGCFIGCTGAAGNAAGEHLAVHLSADAEI